MKTSALGLAALIALAATNASAARIEALPRGAPEPATCQVSVIFGSYAMGTDGVVDSAVRRIIETDPSVLNAVSISWGREGEHTYCLTTRGRREADRLFARIRAQIPRASQRAWTEVRTQWGRSFRNGWR